MNDVQFLLESHVLQPQDAVTPLRQLYFMTQMMLMNPEGAEDARVMFRKSLPLLLANFSNEDVVSATPSIAPTADAPAPSTEVRKIGSNG